MRLSASGLDWFLNGAMSKCGGYNFQVSESHARLVSEPLGTRPVLPIDTDVSIYLSEQGAGTEPRKRKVRLIHRSSCLA